MTDQFRYAAFVSYSSKDSGFARRLHSALERYGIPSSLGKFDLTGRGKKKIASILYSGIAKSSAQAP